MGRGNHVLVVRWQLCGGSLPGQVQEVIYCTWQPHYLLHVLSMPAAGTASAAHIVLFEGSALLAWYVLALCAFVAIVMQ
jgi:hypothetical protein